MLNQHPLLTLIKIILASCECWFRSVPPSSEVIEMPSKLGEVGNVVFFFSTDTVQIHAGFYSSFCHSHILFWQPQPHPLLATTRISPIHQHFFLFFFFYFLTHPPPSFFHQLLWSELQGEVLLRLCEGFIF